MNTYNDMIDKFRLGYQRYVDKHLQAEAVGQWILEVFNVDLSAYNTIEEIVMTAEAWELALHSEPLMVALTSSEYIMTLIAESEVATEKFADAIYYAGQNEKAINVIANYDSLVQQVVNDQTSMEWIASSENAIMVILENENFATQALASEVAMTAFGNSETAVMLICEFVANIPVSSDALTAIDESMTEIDTQIGSVLNGSEISGKIADAHTAIGVAVKAIDDVTENAVMVDNMVALIIENETFCNQIFSNDDMCILMEQYVSVLSTSGNAISAIVDNNREDLFTSLMALDSSYQTISNNAKAIHSICLSKTFMDIYMKGKSPHTYYNNMYNTLVNSSDELFFKNTTYYNTTYKASGVSDYVAYVKDTGIWGYSTVASRTHVGVPVINGVVLFKECGRGHSDYSQTYKNTLTGETLGTPSSSSLTTVNKISMGGVCSYAYGANASILGGMELCTYATFIAI